MGEVEERKKRTDFINGLIKEWRQELKEILTNKKLKASKEDEAIIELGKRLDKVYKKGEYPVMFLTPRGYAKGFERKAKIFIENGKQSRFVTPSTAIEKPFKTKYQKQLITDRAFNLLEPKDIKGDFNYKVKWIHDVVFSKFKEWIEKDEEKANILKFKSSELPVLVDHFKNLSPALPTIKFTDAEFRAMTGLERVSSETIHELAKDYKGLGLDGDLAYWEEEKKKKGEKKGGYTFLTLHESLGGFVSKETGIFSTRGNKPQREHFWIWHYAGFLLFHNLLLGKHTRFPKKFYKMAEGSQEIYRKIAQFPCSEYSISVISKIMGYKKDVLKMKKQHLQKRKQQIIKDLEELKNNHFIWKYEIKGKGKNTVFKIFRIKPIKKSKK